MLDRQLPWFIGTIARQVYWGSLLSVLPWLAQTLPSAWAEHHASTPNLVWHGLAGLWFTVCYVLWAARLQEKDAKSDYRFRDLLADAIDVVTLLALFLVPVLDPRLSSSGSNNVLWILVLSGAPSISNLVAYGVLNSRYGALPEIATGVSLGGAALVWLSPHEAVPIGWFVLGDLTLLLIAYEIFIVDWSRP